MSKVKVQGHASGSGVLTVTAPNTSSDRTITLPDATGTLLNSDGDGSSLTGITAGWSQGCEVKLSGNLAVATTTNTKITFDTETFDSGGNFASNTYTCPSDGKYFIMLRTCIAASVDATRYQSWIDINGSYSGIFAESDPGTNGTVGHMCTGIEDLSTSDTIEAYVWHAAGSTKNISSGETSLAIYKIGT